MTEDIFHGTSGPRSAKIMIVGEAFGKEEFEQQRPWVGEAGRNLDKMLSEAGISRDDCFCSNIVADRPPNNELFRWFIPTADARKQKMESVRGLYPTEKILIGLRVLEAQIKSVNPSVIIGCGNYPLWALTDFARVANSTDPSGWKVPGGISLVRGSHYRTRQQNIPYVPILHPASILRNWATRPITVHDLRVRVANALSGKWDRTTPHYWAPPTLNEVFRFLGRIDVRLARGPVDLAADLETKGHLIACLGLSYDGVSAISIPFVRPTPTGLDSYWKFDEEVAIVRRLRQIFLHPNCQLIGQNFLYDTQYMSRWWRTPPRVHHDTMVAQHVIFPGTPKALWYLASLYCKDYYSFWKDDGKEWASNLDLERLLIYNCDDVIYTWKIAHAQRNVLTQMNLWPQFHFLLEQWVLAFEMMERGVRIDQAVRSEMSLRVMEESAKRQAWLNKVVPEWVRPDVKKGASQWYFSASQQMRLFYEEMGLKSVHHRKTGNPTIDDSALQEIKLRYPELTRLVDTIADLRSLGVFQNNFLSAAIDPDGRMRCSFNVAGPETFRWSSSANAFGRGTNLQNIPTGDEE